MMNQRLLYLAIGCIIGFVLGYMVRSIREVRAEVEEVKEEVIKDHRSDKGSDAGFIKNGIANYVALFLVVGLTAWSAIVSQVASNDVKGSQHQQDRIVSCNQTYLASTITALNARTENSQAQNDANVALQRAQATFLSVFFVDPPASSEQKETALKTYFQALTDFTTASAKTSTNVSQNPYPSTTDFINCIRGK